MSSKIVLSKSELLTWLNGILKECSPGYNRITKVEELGDGAAYCFIFNALHPGLISVQKINQYPKSQYENLNNLKLLTTAFLKANILKHLEIEKIAKMKCQDNLEMLQWLYRYWQERQKNSNGAVQKYDESSQNPQCHSMPNSHKPNSSQQNSKPSLPSLNIDGAQMPKKRRILVKEPPPEQVKENMQEYLNSRPRTRQPEPELFQMKRVANEFSSENPLRQIKSIVDGQDSTDSKKLEMIKSILFGGKTASNNKSSLGYSLSNNIDSSANNRQTGLQNQEAKDSRENNQSVGNFVEHAEHSKSSRLPRVEGNDHTQRGFINKFMARPSMTADKVVSHQQSTYKSPFDSNSFFNGNPFPIDASNPFASISRSQLKSQGANNEQLGLRNHDHSMLLSSSKKVSSNRAHNESLLISEQRSAETPNFASDQATGNKSVRMEMQSMGGSEIKKEFNN